MERNMTNEQKAQTLVDGLGIIYTECNRVTIKKRLMVMAQWKDEQFEAEKQALIDKACEWLRDFLQEHYIMRYDVCCEPCKDVIEREFKQAMKGE